MRQNCLLPPRKRAGISCVEMSHIIFGLLKKLTIELLWLLMVTYNIHINRLKISNFCSYKNRHYTQV